MLIFLNSTVKQAILRHRVISQNPWELKYVEYKHLLKTMRRWYSYHMPVRVGEGRKKKRMHRIWPVSHANAHLSTHPADAGLNGRHATDMNKY